MFSRVFIVTLVFIFSAMYAKVDCRNHGFNGRNDHHVDSEENSVLLRMGISSGEKFDPKKLLEGNGINGDNFQIIFNRPRRAVTVNGTDTTTITTVEQSSTPLLGRNSREEPDVQNIAEKSERRGRRIPKRKQRLKNRKRKFRGRRRNKTIRRKNRKMKRQRNKIRMRKLRRKQKRRRRGKQINPRVGQEQHVSKTSNFVRVGWLKALRRYNSINYLIYPLMKKSTTAASTSFQPKIPKSEDKSISSFPSFKYSSTTPISSKQPSTSATSTSVKSGWLNWWNFNWQPQKIQQQSSSVFSSSATSMPHKTFSFTSTSPNFVRNKAKFFLESTESVRNSIKDDIIVKDRINNKNIPIVTKLAESESTISPPSVKTLAAKENEQDWTEQRHASTVVPAHKSFDYRHNIASTTPLTDQKINNNNNNNSPNTQIGSTVPVELLTGFSRLIVTENYPATESDQQRSVAVEVRVQPAGDESVESNKEGKVLALQLMDLFKSCIQKNSVTDGESVSMLQYITAYRKLTETFEKFGMVLKIASEDIEGKLDDLEILLKGDLNNYGSIEKMFAYEYSTGIAVSDEVTSGVQKNRWIHRGLKMFLEILKEVSKGNNQATSLTSRVQSHYDAILSPHHTFWVRTAVRLALMAFPSYETISSILEVPNDQQGRRQIQRMTGAIQDVYRQIDLLYVEYR